MSFTRGAAWVLTIAQQRSGRLIMQAIVSSWSVYNVGLCAGRFTFLNCADDH
jgi:hypothetical protein